MGCFTLVSMKPKINRMTMPPKISVITTGLVQPMVWWP